MDWTSQSWLWIIIAVAFGWFMMRGGHRRNDAQMTHDGHVDDRMPTATENGAAIDPVSGQAVKIADSVTSLYDGQVYYFASRDNRDRFEAAPGDYATKVKGFPMQRSPAASHRSGGCC